MADEQLDNGNGSDEDETLQFAPEIDIEAQYIKDLSFENPLGAMAPAEVQKSPAINVDVTTGGRPLPNDRYEVSLQIRGEARTEDTTVFIAELTYAAVMTIKNVPQEAIGPVLLIEGARLIFPFARNIIADVTRDGGFPPLFLSPIDFVELYRSQQMDSEGGGDEISPIQ